MTLSSASTNKLISKLTLKLILAGLGAVLGLGGCASRPPSVPARTVYGYVNLSALARQQPGWSGVKRYDAALARLEAASRDLPPIGQADPKMATLSALPPDAGGNDAPAATEAARIAPRLSAVQASLLGSLNDRRAAARADQAARQQDLWKRDARRLFPAPTRTPEISSDLTLQLLEANVAALTQTLDHWDNSTLPAPRLARLKQKVEADRARVEALIAARIQTREAARVARLAAIRQQRQARLDYVKTQGAALAAHLETDDARVLDAQKQRLSQQKLTLLAALARPDPSSVPASGNAGTLTLPSGPGAARASLSAQSLSEARARLVTQRSRWLAYLTDDTRASALDAAGRQHWNITFGPPRRGDRDLTAALARVLATEHS